MRGRTLLRSASSFAGMALSLLLGGPAARAVPLIEVQVVSNDGTTGVVDVFITTPTEGMMGYAFSVAYTGTLALTSATCIDPPGDIFSCNGSAANHPGDAPFYGSFFGLSEPTGDPAAFHPFGVGGETYHVGTLVFDIHGAGGSLEPGILNPGVDGFATADWEFSVDGDFAGANLGLFAFRGAALVPEPGTASLLALGLAGLGLRQRTRRSRNAADPTV